MRALAYWIGLSAVLTFTACKFDSPNSAPDSATAPTVEFATATTLVDEKSGLVQIPVLLSAPATATVGFRVSGGTATRPADFVRDDGSLEFTNAGSANIEITIQTDNLEEADETIELELTTATGAKLGQAHHTITISSDILPRVSIVGGTVSELESVAGSLALHLDLPPKAPVSVDLVLAGSAQAADYAVIAQTVVFGVNETDKAIPLGVVDDAIDEDDQTIDVDLAIPVGLVIDVAGSHATHTILDNDAAPTVGFLNATATKLENNTDDTQTVQLTGLTEKIVTVQYAQTSGTAGVADVVIGGTGTLTFTPGQTQQAIPITIQDDTLDENDEDAVVTLSGQTNATLAGATHTLTITDDDNPPQVAFATATTNVTEGTAQITVTVTLTANSGLPITVAFAAAGTSTASAATDFAFVTASPLAFAPGENTKDITITISNDAIGEVDETINLVLSGQTNSSLGAQSTHVVTIADNDCLGTGAFKVCPTAAPAGTLNLSGSLNTTNDARCGAQPAGWAAQGQDPVCIITAADINVNGAGLNLTGARPLILLATGTITVSSTLDASATATANASAAPSALCKAFPGPAPNADSNGGAGGAGASFMSIGGDGGDNSTGNTSGGTAPAIDAADPIKLRAGCKGQKGGNGNGGSAVGGAGGGAGGAVYLVAGTITISGAIDVSGGGGAGGVVDAAGGGGGGSGGMLLLDATTLNANGTLIANGGGGGQGADNNTNGGAGGEPSTGQPTTPAAGGGTGGAGANGGNGFVTGTSATVGATSASGKGAGAGGGGGGFIKGSGPLGGTVSAGKILP